MLESRILSAYVVGVGPAPGAAPFFLSVGFSQCATLAFVGRVPFRTGGPFLRFPQKWGFFRARVPRPNRSPWTPATHIVLALAESRSGGCRTGAAQGAAPFASKVQVLLKAQLCDTAAGNVISALSQHSLITFGADHASMKPRRVGLRRSIPNCSKARSPSLFVIRSKGLAGHPRTTWKSLSERIGIRTQRIPG